ncbi:Transposable element P transposase [Lucilia cuprina]|nr:Transposable element P transposase [Lucilia cuprina]
MKVAETFQYDPVANHVKKPSNYVQVIMVRGLRKSWKQPVFYDSDCFIVVAIGCDKCPTNRKLWNELGVTPDATNSKATPSENELLSYLSDADTSLRNLKKFPIIYEVFMKYNTPITSSAPAERLFSIAGLLNTPRRNSISEEHLELLVILKTVFKQNSSIVLHNLN